MTIEPITEAERDRIYAQAFGRAPDVDPASHSMTLAEAEDVWTGNVFHRPGLTPQMVAESRQVLAAAAETVALAEPVPAALNAQESQLEAARQRVEVAAQAQGRTAAEATSYSKTLLTTIQESARREGRSLAQVVESVNNGAAYLRRTKRT